MLDQKVIEILQKKNSKAIGVYLKKTYPNVKETQQNKALIKAIFIPCLYNENPGVVKFVLSYFKLDPNMDLGENNLKPIHLAAASGSFEAICDLLHAGADPTARIILKNKATATLQCIFYNCARMQRAVHNTHN